MEFWHGQFGDRGHLVRSVFEDNGPWYNPPELETDPVIRASQYFRQVRQVALQPDWVVMTNPEEQYLAVQTWIGLHIHHLNQNLHFMLVELLDCFQPQRRPWVQILAAPIATKIGIDGFCNLQGQPITIVVDPSRVVRANWPYLIAHELAHAVARTAGHGLPFHQALSHLCLAQDWPLPPMDNEVLKYWPPCRSNPQAGEFWLGRGESWAHLSS